jgi:hypothetical protein
MTTSCPAEGKDLPSNNLPAEHTGTEQRHATRQLATSITSQGVAEGPLVDGARVVTGFYVLEAPDMKTAVAIAGTNNVISHGGGVEVRPVHSGGMVSNT